MEEEEKPSVFLHKKHDIVIGVIMTLILLFLMYKAYQYDGTETEKYTFWFTEKANLPVAIVCCLAAGFLMNIRFPWKIYNLVRSFIAVTVIPFLAILFLQYYTIDPWGEKPIYPKMLLCNAVFYYLIYLLVVFIAGSFSLGYMISTAFFMAVGMANYFIMQFRGSPIVPWDFFSLGTAFSVADNYSYEITWRFMHATFAFVFMLILSQKITWKPKKMIIRIPAVCLSLGLLVFAGKELQKTSVKDWLGMDQTLFTPTVRYRNNGFLAAFVGNLHLIDVQKPDGYSADKVKEVQTKIENSDTYREETAATANFDISKAPNIIVIMDEAFSDLSARGSFEVSEDPIPFFHKMQEENAGGKLMVSVKGGNTANTEWEFLSGDTMAFLPTGSVVFQQFIHDNVPALPAYLASLGYSTTAIHPYRGSGWNRDKVYPMIGFQQFLTQDDFVNPKYLRNFISDNRTSEVTLTDDAQRLLKSYHWPGNVRQLKSVIEQVALFESGNTVDAATLSQYMPANRDTALTVQSQPNFDYNAEREQLFTLILSMRAEIEALKKRMDGVGPTSHVSSSVHELKRESNPLLDLGNTGNDMNMASPYRNMQHEPQDSWTKSPPWTLRARP